MSTEPSASTPANEVLPPASPFARFSRSPVVVRQASPGEERVVGQNIKFKASSLVPPSPRAGTLIGGTFRCTPKTLDEISKEVKERGSKARDARAYKPSILTPETSRKSMVVAGCHLSTLIGMGATAFKTTISDKGHLTISGELPKNAAIDPAVSALEAEVARLTKLINKLTA